MLESFEKHVRYVSPYRDMPLRFANLLLLLPPMLAISRDLVEDVQLAKLFGLASIDNLMLELMLPNEGKNSNEKPLTCHQWISFTDTRVWPKAWPQYPFLLKILLSLDIFSVCFLFTRLFEEDGRKNGNFPTRRVNFLLNMLTKCTFDQVARFFRKTRSRQDSAKTNNLNIHDGSCALIKNVNDVKKKFILTKCEIINPFPFTR